MSSTITFTWYDAASDSTDIYTHDFTDANYTRIIEMGRRAYGTMNAQTMTLELASRNKARKELCKEVVRLWKERVRQEEILIAQQGVVANVPPIDSTEI